MNLTAVEANGLHEALAQHLGPTMQELILTRLIEAIKQDAYDRGYTQAETDNI